MSPQPYRVNGDTVRRHEASESPPGTIHNPIRVTDSPFRLEAGKWYVAAFTATIREAEDGFELLPASPAVTHTEQPSD